MEPKDCARIGTSDGDLKLERNKSSSGYTTTIYLQNHNSLNQPSLGSTTTIQREQYTISIQVCDRNAIQGLVQKGVHIPPWFYEDVIEKAKTTLYVSGEKVLETEGQNVQSNSSQTSSAREVHSAGLLLNFRKELDKETINSLLEYIKRNLNHISERITGEVLLWLMNGCIYTKSFSEPFVEASINLCLRNFIRCLRDSYAKNLPESNFVKPPGISCLSSINIQRPNLLKEVKEGNPSETTYYGGNSSQLIKVSGESSDSKIIPNTETTSEFQNRNKPKNKISTQSSEEQRNLPTNQTDKNETFQRDDGKNDKNERREVQERKTGDQFLTSEQNFTQKEEKIGCDVLRGKPESKSTPQGEEPTESCSRTQGISTKKETWDPKRPMQNDGSQKKEEEDRVARTVRCDVKEKLEETRYQGQHGNRNAISTMKFHDDTMKTREYSKADSTPIAFTNSPLGRDHQDRDLNSSKCHSEQHSGSRKSDEGKEACSKKFGYDEGRGQSSLQELDTELQLEMKMQVQQGSVMENISRDVGKHDHTCKSSGTTKSNTVDKHSQTATDLNNSEVLKNLQTEVDNMKEQLFGLQLNSDCSKSDVTTAPGKCSRNFPERPHDAQLSEQPTKKIKLNEKEREKSEGPTGNPKKTSEEKANGTQQRQNELLNGLTSTKDQQETSTSGNETSGHASITSFLEPIECKEVCGIERKYYGVVNGDFPEKVIILLGASGCGKTTLLNFIANYFHGVKTADDQLIHVEANSNDCASRTRRIRAYTFCPKREDVPMTVIDTPGLNDSSGAEVRDHVQSLKTFLANASSQNLEIHAIGFVAQAHLVRLTSSERLVMDYVTTLFGEAAKDHFLTFVTFADNQTTPPVVEAMENYGIKAKLFYKFNNSTLTAKKSDDIDDMDRVFWRSGYRNWKKCKKYCLDLPPLSVNVMRTIQNDIYTSTVVETAERDLRAEIKAFINDNRKEGVMSKNAKESGQRVWDLATVVEQAKCTQGESPTDVEEILIASVKDVCRDAGILNPDWYIKSLSLATTRSLWGAAFALLVGLRPIYDMSMVKAKVPRNEANSCKYTLYCFQCNKHCSMKKEKTPKSLIPGFLKGSSPITFSCLECECDGFLHGEDPNGEVIRKDILSRSEVLSHARTCLKDILTKMSIDGYEISLTEFLNCIKQEKFLQSEKLIQDLLIFVKDKSY